MKLYLLLGVMCVLSIQLRSQGKPSLERLSWLAGCWDGSTAGKENLEQWMKPSGGTMLGMSRTVKGGKTTEFEFMRIHQESNGDIFYTANPSGQKEASFKLLSKDSTGLIFENKEHDFPQRIVYRLENDGSLKAWIEGKLNGRDMRIEFPMKRAKCE